MRSRHIVASAAAIAALAGGAAAAVAATNDDKKANETAVLSTAASKLGVSADDLRSALSDAEAAQLAAQVKAGQLTQAQADAITARRTADGTVLDLGVGPGGHGGPGGRGGGPRLADDAAKAIGITTTALFDQLRAGKSLEDVAKANNKTLADVEAAVKTSATADLKADLDAKKITQAQYDDQVGDLDDQIAALAAGQLGGHGGPGGRGGTPPTTTTP